MNKVVATLLLLLRDGTGSPGRLSVYVADSLSVVAARAAAEALAGAVGAVSGCSLVGYSVVYETVVSDERPGQSDRREVLRLVFATEGGGYAAVDIPGLFADLVGEDGLSVDGSSGTVGALVSDLLSGPWCNPFGQQLTALLASYREVQA